MLMCRKPTTLTFDGSKPYSRSISRVPRHQRVSTCAAYNPAWEQSDNENEHLSIFQPKDLPFIDNTNVLDARDALESCSGLWGEEKRDCYAIFGLDSDHVERYFEIVTALEAALDIDTEPFEDATHNGIERC